MSEVELTFELALFAAFAFLVAGTIKGTLGVGLPTVSISILAQVVDPRVAITLLLLPAVFTNAWQLYRGGQIIRSAKKLWPFVVTMCVLMFATSLVATEVSSEALTIGIGVVVVGWTFTSFIRTPPRIPPRLERPFLYGFGALSGLIGGLTAIWAPPLVIYLLSIRCSKEDFVRFTGFIIFCGTLPLTAGYIMNGLLNKSTAVASALMIVPALVGFAIGEVLRKPLSGPLFYKLVLVVFMFMGLNLIRRAVFI